jgi:hypothetical protein
MGVSRDEQLQAVEQAVEDHIDDTGLFPSTTDVIAKAGLPNGATRAALDRLVRQDRIKAVYEAAKNPTVYLPTYRYKAVLRKQRAPAWLSKYAFKEAESIQREIRAQEDRLTVFGLVESLLYGTGRRLEEAVKQAFIILEIEDLTTPYEDPDSWDFSFSYDGLTYVIDVKGKSKWADKSDVAQLQQWLEKYVDQHPQKDPGRIRGGLMINHFKDIDPAERWPARSDRAPLSEAGERYLKLGGRLFFTTVDIFKIAQRVIHREISTTEGRIQLRSRFRKGLTSE